MWSLNFFQTLNISMFICWASDHYWLMFQVICETSHVFCISYKKCASNLVVSLLFKLWSIIAWLGIHHAYQLLKGKVLFVFLSIQVFSIITSNTCHLQLLFMCYSLCCHLQLVLKWTCQLNLHFLKSLMFNLLKIKVTCLHFIILLWFMLCLVNL